MLSHGEGKRWLSSGEAVAELDVDESTRRDGGAGGTHGGLRSSAEMKGRRSCTVHDSAEKKQGGDVRGTLEQRVWCGGSTTW